LDGACAAIVPFGRDVDQRRGSRHAVRLPRAFQSSKRSTGQRDVDGRFQLSPGPLEMGRGLPVAEAVDLHRRHQSHGLHLSRLICVQIPSVEVEMNSGALPHGRVDSWRSVTEQWRPQEIDERGKSDSSSLRHMNNERQAPHRSAKRAICPAGPNDLPPSGPWAHLRIKVAHNDLPLSGCNSFIFQMLQDRVQWKMIGFDQSSRWVHAAAD
jgi:hypothetical protein